jgi:hypothetical protein
MADFIWAICGFIFGGVVGAVWMRMFLFRLSSAGTLLVQDTEERTIFTLDLAQNPEALATQKEVLFKVKHQ